MLLLKGSLALVFRYFLLIGGGWAAGAGWITQTSVSHFCFDARQVADLSAGAILAMTGGGASVAAGVAWRWWAKRNRGVT